MFTSVTIEDGNGIDVELFNGTRRLGECHGLHGLPQPRRIVRPRTGQHGEINQTKHYGSRQPVWNGQLTGADDAALWVEYDAIMAALWGSVGNERLLKWTRADGLELQSAVKLADAFDPVLRAGDAGRVLAYQLVLDREDPRNFSQAETEVLGATLDELGGGMVMPAVMPVTFTTSSGGKAVIVDAGPTGTSPVYEIRGGIVAPAIRIQETGESIVLTGQVGANSRLEVDVRRRRVLLDGTANRENLIDFRLTTWADLPPGGSTVQLLGASFDTAARLVVRYRPGHP